MFFVVACDVAALMATCARCGLTLINVMQMGAHKRRCKRTTPTPGTNESNGVENFGDATNIADACAMTAETESAAVQEPDATLAVIHAPVTSLQSLARREKKGWGRQCSLTLDSRPERCSGALARDFREVRAKVQTVLNNDRLSTHLSAHVQTVYLHVIWFVYENVVDTPFYT